MRAPALTLCLIPDLDIYRSTNLLVKQHGEDAPIEAAMRADTQGGGRLGAGAGARVH